MDLGGGRKKNKQKQSDFSMVASSSSAAADWRPPKNEVFMSYSVDTGTSFTSFLHRALCNKHINTYIDKESLEKSVISIKESAISIVIFSEKYAEYHLCLDELVHILKCREEKDQIVLPIFYGIDPSYIQNQGGACAAAFVKHNNHLKGNMEKVQKWRRALTTAADLSGWDSLGKSESVLVQQVVEHVIRKLKSIWSTSIDDLKGVGIRRQLYKIESLLDFDSPTVRTLGICGMRGIGKTKLALVAYQYFSNRFDGSCFLESVSEEAQRKGPVELEKELFSKLLGEEDLDVYNPDINAKLSRTKALLVLDDVDNFYHFKRLAGDRGRFGQLTKIIVTSRDLQVLNQLCDVRYEVEALDLNEASQLFYLKAFEENSCRPGYEEISAKVVRYAAGNPFALEDLALRFKQLPLQRWESEFEELKRTVRSDIENTEGGEDIVSSCVHCLSNLCNFK